MSGPKDVTGVTRRLQRNYEAAINRIAKRVLTPRKKTQTLQEWLAEIAQRSTAQDVRSAAEFVAGQMIARVNAKNARSWRQAAAKSQRTRFLYEAMRKELQGTVGLRLRQLREEQVKYITSVAPTAAAHLVHEITELELKGARPETVAKMARQRFPELLRSRVHLIARTGAQKTASVLTRARAENVGVHFYEWITSEDARVRDSHKKMNGVIIFYDDPPSPEALIGEHSTLGRYHSGECPNCRCTQAPVLHVDDLHFPVKAYSRGGVHTYAKQPFLKLATTYDSVVTKAA